jgi:hypothetical protein
MTIRRIFLWLYIVLFSVNMYLWPTSKYEWMLSEPNAKQDGTTACTLPIDGNAWYLEIFTLPPALVLLALGAFLSVRKRRVSSALLGGLLLLVFWVARIFVFRFNC